MLLACLGQGSPPVSVHPNGPLDHQNHCMQLLLPQSLQDGVVGVLE